MVKKRTTLLAAIILLSGCTREVYLQEVPCVEGDCDCPCVAENRECCPETEMLTETITYQVTDMPTAPSTYTPCNTTTTTRTCRKVCREVRID